MGAGAGHPEPSRRRSSQEARRRAEIAKPAMPSSLPSAAAISLSRSQLGQGKEFEFVILIDISKGCVYDLKDVRTVPLPKSGQKNCETSLSFHQGQGFIVPTECKGAVGDLK